MNDLREYIKSLTEFSDTSWSLLQTALTLKNFKKNQQLLSEGDVCNSLFYISKGYCRSYYNVDGVEKNIAFFFENDIATNSDSFGTGQRSNFTIVACEPLSAVVIDKKQLTKISKESIEIERLGHRAAMRFTTKQQEFSNILRLYTPQKRLAFIEQNYPEMLQRVSLSQLSSFIGVTRETLSRIRNKNNL